MKSRFWRPQPRRSSLRRDGWKTMGSMFPICMRPSRSSRPSRLSDERGASLNEKTNMDLRTHWKKIYATKAPTRSAGIVHTLKLRWCSLNERPLIAPYRSLMREAARQRLLMTCLRANFGTLPSGSSESAIESLALEERGLADWLNLGKLRTHVVICRAPGPERPSLSQAMRIVRNRNSAQNATLR